MAHSFNVMPSVNISRSKFDRVSGHKTSFNLGQIVPLYIDEVLPGDTRKFDMSSLIRMSTPIAPIMDDIEMDVFAFFVPNRLAFDQWKEVMGENTTGAGIQANSVNVPMVTITNGTIPVGSVGDYMGLPNSAAGTSYDVSVLPLRGMKLIYNRWFRNQNVTAPLSVDTSSSTTYDDYTISPLIAAKKADYFTRSLPYAQKGNPVTIPLGQTAPVYAGSSDNVAWGYPLKLATGISGTNYTYATGPLEIAGGDSGGLKTYGSQSGTATNSLYPSNLVADLSNATAATINQLRLAFQTQKLLEKDSLYGTRYWEILVAHFGVVSPDASLQDPEYLGGQKFMINVDQVLQTTGYDDSASSELAQVGANSVTGWNGSLFTKSFTEHGFLHVYGVARQKHRTYGQGLNRMWSKSGRFDFYWPVFANLGAQDVKKKELYVDGGNTNFGYQEAWAEYRYKPNLVTGILNPARVNSLDYWTLAEAFAAAPTLGDTFIKEDRANLSRALTTGVSGPDFIADFYFKDTAVRPMPTYSIPGLIDHH